MNIQQTINASHVRQEKNHETTNSLDHFLLHFVRRLVLCPVTRPPRRKTRFSSDPAVFVLYLHEIMISKKKMDTAGLRTLCLPWTDSASNTEYIGEKP